MDHNEATTTRATEKYLLNELEPDLRNQFEEHVFDCNECALDLRVATIFVENSKIILGQPRPLREPVPAPTWGWMQWLRPAVTIPVMATLLAVIGYQATNRSRDFASGPQLINSLSLIAANARGGSSNSATAPSEKPFVMYVDVPPVAQATSFAADFHNPDGSLLWTLPITGDAAKDTLTIQVPAVSGPAGTYILVIRSINGVGQSTEVARYPVAIGLR
jgi:hypothetical protein